MRRLAIAILAIATLCIVQPVRAQFVNKWLSAGSLHNWYSEVGSEVEVQGFVGNQQDGLRWPGIYQYRDAQAAKALWIGAKNVTDDFGTNWATRVVHAGPRVLGSGEFFPVRFDMISRFDPPLVTVEGIDTLPEAAMANDLVDPSIPADRMILSEVNTLLGLTMERRIMQFSQDWHDNYHVVEYTFTNTGNTDGDSDIEVPNQTLEDVVIFLQWRWSVVAESRYVIGNATGWGINAMLDTRGDGVIVDPPGEQFRAQFVWHGRFPSFTLYDNVGGPILKSALPAVWIAESDTLGRLGASEFVGVVTLHADQSPANPDDDTSQPTTTTWIGSDEPFTSQNSAFNQARMDLEYGLMTAGHKSPRHAWVVEPSGMEGWLNPTGNPALTTPGGYSSTQGYGPYTLGPGESVRIVIAEAAAGLSREANESIGHQWQEAGADPDAPLTFSFGGQSHTMTKNEWVFTSRDSLFQTFRRAQANFDSDYEAMPQAPLPPSTFDVSVSESQSDVLLTWSTFPDADHDGFEIYRARERYDSTYTLIHTAAVGDRAFADLTAIREVDYFYYIVSTKSGSTNDGGALTPAGRTLRSNRYYTQTYNPIRLRSLVAVDQEQPGFYRLDDPYPNPFNTSTTIAYAIPAASFIELTVFDVTGRRVRVLDSGIRPSGRHELSFDAAAMPSGVYVYALTAGAYTKTKTMVLLR